MDQKLYKEMKQFQEDFDNLPDGAFFALAEENGYTVEDWAEFSRMRDDEEELPCPDCAQAGRTGTLKTLTRREKTRAGITESEWLGCDECKYLEKK